MQIKCEYCGNFLDDSNQFCPNCGATNNNMKRNAIGTPETIAQLQQWYTEHHLPPENVTRFFIGKDIKEARAFGIYLDNDGNYIVYKNKSDGSRAVRYRGKDEKYAVNELYLKLKSEIQNQKSHQNNNTQSQKNSKRVALQVIAFYAAIIIIISGIGIFAGRHNGYYRYGDSYYYYQSGSWYGYNDGWYPTTVPGELDDNKDDYYSGSSYDSGYGVSDFSDSSYYDDDWDSDSDWDSGSSWDSSSSDWDSDW